MEVSGLLNIQKIYFFSLFVSVSKELQQQKSTEILIKVNDGDCKVCIDNIQEESFRYYRSYQSLKILKSPTLHSTHHQHS